MVFKILLIIVLSIHKIKCDCSSNENDSDYMGSISKTALGLTCQYWNIQSPHAHNYGNKSDFIDGLDDAQNFCRNPRNEEVKAWCYTIDPNVRWGYCNIPKCMGCTPIHGFKYMTLEIKYKKQYQDGSYKPGTEINFSCMEGAIYDEFSGPLNIKCDNSGRWSSYQLPKCLWQVKANNQPFSNCWYYQKDEKRNQIIVYNGNVSKTKNDIPCESWKKQDDYDETYFGDSGIIGAVNFCRTIDNSKPWCYTNSKKNVWAYCSVEQCNGCGYIPYVKYSNYQLLNITVDNTENTIQTGTINYVCNYGTLIGSDTLRCINGEWIPAQPRCDVTYCSTNFPTINDGYLWKKQPIYASSEDYNKDKYMIDGSKLIYKLNVDCINENDCQDKQLFTCKNGQWINN